MKTAFLILLFYLPFQIALNPAPGIDLASGRLFILILFFFWLGLGFFKKNLKFAVNFQTLSLLLFLTAAVFSLATAMAGQAGAMAGQAGAQNIGWGLRKIVFFLTIFPVYFLAAEFLKTDEDLKSASKAVSAAVLITSFFGIFQFFGQFIFGAEGLKNFLSSFIAPLFWGAEFGGQVVSNPSWFVNIGGETYFRAISFFPDPHIFAFYLAIALPFIAADLSSSRDDNFKKLKIAALVCGVIALFLTFSRGAYLGFIGALIFTAILTFIKAGILSRENLKKTAAFGAVVLITAVIILNFNNPISQRFYATFNLTEGSNAQRIAIWKESLEIFKNNPLFGIGIGNYVVEKNILADYRDPSNAHNLYLDIAVETGIFGLAAWLILLFGTLWKLSSRANDKRAIFLVAGLVWFSVHGFFETAIYSPVILPLLLVYLAAGIKSFSDENRNAKIIQNKADKSFLK